MTDLQINTIKGSSISVIGNDIDTDRIIPARFLKCVVFEGLGEHAFSDDRKEVQEKGEVHPFDNPKFNNASILFVNKNFGCGSSREHAPQSLKRWGIKAIIGESFSEIFFGNNIALGIPCLTCDQETITALQNASNNNPESIFTISLEDLSISYDDTKFNLSLAQGARMQFLDGSWNVTNQLLKNVSLIKEINQSLKYSY